jgi:hypothetical protein
MITINPEITPEAPNPDIARPTIKKIELRAEPQTAGPTSKSVVPMRKSGLAG